MGLKISLEKGDVALLSGGIAMIIDDVRQEPDAADITIAITNKDKTEFIEWEVRYDDRFPLGAAQVYTKEVMKLDGGNTSIAFNIVAPREIKIHRFHQGQSDFRLTKILNKFDDNDNKDGIIASLKVLLEENS